MAFFDEIPELPPRPHQPQPPSPGWMGPPSGELPGILTVGGLLHSNDRLGVALKLVEVYSTGCVLDLVWSARRRDETEREWRDVVEESFGRPGRPRVMVGVAFPDGRKVVAGDPTPSMFEGSDAVTGPVLLHHGGGRTGSNDEQMEGTMRYWLWPLPVDGDTQVFVKWDALGMPESSLTLCDEQLREAQTKIRRFWAD